MGCIDAHIERVDGVGAAVSRMEAVSATVSLVCSLSTYLRVLSGEDPVWVYAEFEFPVQIESNTNWNIF